MSTELYADGIGEITVTGTIVRIDLMSLSATERDSDNNNGNPSPSKPDAGTPEVKPQMKCAP